MSSSTESGNCPICKTLSSTEFHRDTGKKSLKRLHLLCNNCFAIFVPSSYYVTNSTEKSRYDVHQNDSEQEGYRNFLNQSVRPLVLYLCTKYISSQNNKSNSNNNNETIPTYENLLSHHFTNLREPKPETASEKEIAEYQESLRLDAQEKEMLMKAVTLERSLREANGAECCERKYEKDNNPSFKGLDFGCGPGPTLNKMISGNIPTLVNFDDIALYDKYYFPKEEGVFYEESQQQEVREAKRRQRENNSTSKDNDDDDNSNKNNITENDTTIVSSPAGETSNKKTPILYDFITATEVAEHISNAGEELTRLWNHVKPNGGVLVIQTSRPEAHCAPKPPKASSSPSQNAVANYTITESKFKQECDAQNKQQQLLSASTPHPDPEKHKLEQLTGINLFRYGQWHYIRDDTHIVFFHLKSFEFLREKWGNEVEAMIVCGPSVVMFVKK